MARQNSLVKLKGTLGDITFFKSRDGHMVREKGGIDGKRIATDPAFQRTRENGWEFGRAARAGKVLRMAVRPLLINAMDSRAVSRLTQSMMAVLKADAVSARGLRNVIDGEAELLSGFEFNINGILDTTLYVPYATAINRTTGELTVSINSFIPDNMLVGPIGASHFKIVSGATEVDFEQGSFISDFSETAILPLGEVATAVITLNNQVTAASTKPLFLVMGINFFEEVNGRMYPLKNGAFNPLSIVKVDGGA